MAHPRVLSKPAAGIAAIGLSLLVLIGAAPAALANSFGEGYYDVSFTYSDEVDKFCAEPRNGYDVNVLLAPIPADRGPAYSAELPAGSGVKCFSLATAYEDTEYTYGVFTREHDYRGTFYS